RLLTVAVSSGPPTLQKHPNRRLSSLNNRDLLDPSSAFSGCVVLAPDMAGETSRCQGKPDSSREMRNIGQTRVFHLL
ncbi:mCG1049168, isoform CRA_a, partial [Mus musculus]